VREKEYLNLLTTIGAIGWLSLLNKALQETCTQDHEAACIHNCFSNNNILSINILVCPKQSTRDKLLGFYFIKFWNTDCIIICSILNLVSKFLDVLSVPHLEKMPVASQNKDSQRESRALVLADSCWAVVCLQKLNGEDLTSFRSPCLKPLQNLEGRKEEESALPQCPDVDENSVKLTSNRSN
jgi:hypothetical protein